MTTTFIETVVLSTPKIMDLAEIISSNRSMRVKLKQATLFTGTKMKRAHDLVNYLISSLSTLNDDQQFEVISCIGFLLEEIQDEERNVTLQTKKVIRRSL